MEVLSLFNRAWEERVLMWVWKHAMVVPIQKPGTGGSSPLSYRPLALSSVTSNMMHGEDGS